MEGIRLTPAAKKRKTNITSKVCIICAVDDSTRKTYGTDNGRTKLREASRTRDDASLLEIFYSWCSLLPPLSRVFSASTGSCTCNQAVCAICIPIRANSPSLVHQHKLAHCRNRRSCDQSYLSWIPTTVALQGMFTIR